MTTVTLYQWVGAGKHTVAERGGKGLFTFFPASREVSVLMSELPRSRIRNKTQPPYETINNDYLTTPIICWRAVALMQERRGKTMGGGGEPIDCSMKSWSRKWSLWRRGGSGACQTHTLITSHTYFPHMLSLSYHILILETHL